MDRRLTDLHCTATAHGAQDESRVPCPIDYFLLRFFLARVTSNSTTAMTPMTKMMKADDRNELSPIRISRRSSAAERCTRFSLASGLLDRVKYAAFVRRRGRLQQRKSAASRLQWRLLSKSRLAPRLLMRTRSNHAGGEAIAEFVSFQSENCRNSCVLGIGQAGFHKLIRRMCKEGASGIHNDVRLQRSASRQETFETYARL